MDNFLERIILYIYKKGKSLSRLDYERKIRNKYRIPSSFKFNGENISFYGKGKLTISENSYIGAFSTIQIQEGFEVRIGKNCKISHNVRIYTTSNYPDQDFNNGNVDTYSKNVTIGDGVWIGANVFINPGVNIGSNSIVGANSIVTKDIPGNAIVGGVPAKLIRFKEQEC